ncbi:MAG: flagellar export chaperone FliS [Gammaproteobacteria bacterium]
MSYSARNRVETLYQKVDVITKFENASPYRIIQMLMEGALEKIAMAKGFMQRKEIAKCGAHISWAISIIDGLRMSLDLSQGVIAENLDNLYDYMNRCLLKANIDQDPDKLDEVSKLLLEIKAGWDAIPPEQQVHPTQTQTK